MTPQTPKQLGVCNWSLHPKDTHDLIEQVKQIGLKKLQVAVIAIGGDEKLAEQTFTQLTDAGFTLASGMFSCAGEDYTSPDSIRRTGGFLSDEHWKESWRRAQDAAIAVSRMRMKMVSTHAGFMPDDTADPNHEKLKTRLAMVADHMRNFDLTLLFETGQESAATLNRFLDELGHDNVGINFDPANMILYDKGNPVEALSALMPRVKQVHLKDAKRATTPGTWGLEVALGQGDVDWVGVFNVLAENDYTGDLIIEREAGDQRITDIKQGITFITDIMQQTAK